MAEIKLYQFGPIADRESASPFYVKLHYPLRYKGLPFEAVNLASPTQVKKYNPRGKLPVLGYDGTLILDSRDVVHYIEQRHPEPRLCPENNGNALKRSCSRTGLMSRSTGTSFTKTG